MLSEDPENSCATSVSKHIPSSFSMFMICSLRSIENKHDVNRDKDCMNKFSESLRQHRMKIKLLTKKKMKLLTKKQQESYKNVKIGYICKEKFDD